MKILIPLLFVLNCAFSNSVSQASQSSQSVSTSLQSISTMFNSVSSISGSLSSISTSSSKKKEDEEKKSLFRRDVRDLTYLHIKSGNLDSFPKDLQSLSRRHGIVDWRAIDASYLGMGEGMRKAGSNPDEIHKLSLSLPPREASLFRKGYSL